MEREIVIETGIELVSKKIFGDSKCHEYTCECGDGVAIGIRENDDDDKAPRRLKITYPTLSEVLGKEDLCDAILKYRGLYDLSPEDINYGDIMIYSGKIDEVLIK